MEIKDRAFAVVTGASSGIGFEAARALAARGHNVILCARRTEKLRELAERIEAENRDVRAVIMPCDLSRCDGAENLWQKLVPFPFDLFINCAGFGYYGRVETQDPAQMLEMLRVDVEALAYLSRMFVSRCKNVEGAQLINISSAGGYTIVPNAVAYCAAKFFVSAFTEGLDAELRAGGYPLRAKVLAPAATQTEFGAVASGDPGYDYDAVFPRRHSAEEMAQFLLQLLDSECTVGAVDRNTFEFLLRDGIMPAPPQSLADSAR